jgi:hypothetical protein
MPATSPDTIAVLNRVLVVLQRSFSQYLRYARPYIPPGRESVMHTIDEIVTCQDSLAQRIEEFIHESGGSPEPGRFPIEFTDTHDLAIDYLIREAIGYQKEDIASLEKCVEQLRLSPAAQSLASEALGMAKGHLESLEELPVQPGATTKFGAMPAFANDVPVANELTGTPHRQKVPKLAAGDPHSPG